jgi:hypothetical protein
MLRFLYIIGVLVACYTIANRSLMLPVGVAVVMLFARSIVAQFWVVLIPFFFNLLLRLLLEHNSTCRLESAKHAVALMDKPELATTQWVDWG